MYQRGLIIKIIQKCGGDPPSTIVPALKNLIELFKNQNTKTKSPDKTFLKEALSFIEIQIVNRHLILYYCLIPWHNIPSASHKKQCFI